MWECISYREINEVRFSSADVAIYVIIVAVEFQHSIIIVNSSVKIAMWTVQQKVSCVLWLAETKSVKLVQHRFRREYNLQSHWCTVNLILDESP